MIHKTIFHKIVVYCHQLLPPIFQNADVKTQALFITDEILAEGGPAMTAYAKMQFSDMSIEEKYHIITGLLRYCELDTLAMVWEHCNNIILYSN